MSTKQFATSVERKQESCVNRRWITWMLVDVVARVFFVALFARCIYTCLAILATKKTKQRNRSMSVTYDNKQRSQTSTQSFNIDSRGQMIGVTCFDLFFHRVFLSLFRWVSCLWFQLLRSNSHGTYHYRSTSYSTTNVITKGTCIFISRECLNIVFYLNVWRRNNEKIIDRIMTSKAILRISVRTRNNHL
jgi:hypothetical protein